MPWVWGHLNKGLQVKLDQFCYKTCEELYIGFSTLSWPHGHLLFLCWNLVHIEEHNDVSRLLSSLVILIGFMDETNNFSHKHFCWVFQKTHFFTLYHSLSKECSFIVIFCLLSLRWVYRRSFSLPPTHPLNPSFRLWKQDGEFKSSYFHSSLFHHAPYLLNYKPHWWIELVYSGLQTVATLMYGS